MSVFDDVLANLRAGNDRFARGEGSPRAYSAEEFARLAEGQTPHAAVVACADSRVCPEFVFDQPLGAIFVSRVPANVASDSAKWMIDLAVGEFKVPIVVVLAHSGCLAVKQIVEGRDGPGGMLRYRVRSAFHDVSAISNEDVYERTIDENARKTCRDLIQESNAMGDAVRAGRTRILPARYDMATGRVVWLDI